MTLNIPTHDLLDQHADIIQKTYKIHATEATSHPSLTPNINGRIAHFLFCNAYLLQLKVKTVCLWRWTWWHQRWGEKQERKFILSHFQQDDTNLRFTSNIWHPFNRRFTHKMFVKRIIWCAACLQMLHTHTHKALLWHCHSYSGFSLFGFVFGVNCGPSLVCVDYSFSSAVFTSVTHSSCYSNPLFCLVLLRLLTVFCCVDSCVSIGYIKEPLWIRLPLVFFGYTHIPVTDRTSALELIIKFLRRTHEWGQIHPTSVNLAQRINENIWI